MKQFTSIDPARNGRNWTGYCLENPLRFIDLTGMAAQSISDLTVWEVRDSLVEKNYLKAYCQMEMIKFDIAYSAANAGANATLGEGVAILESSARGASFLGRVTVGNLFPGTKEYFYRLDCGIYKAESWLRENIVTDPEAYGFAKGVTEKYILPIYGAAKLAEGGYHLYQNYGGSVKNFMLDETGSARIPGSITKSEHAQIRSSQGRNVNTAINDLNKAKPSNIYLQNDGRYVIKGANGRVHILEPGGELVTTMNSVQNFAKRVSRGQYSPLTESEKMSFASKFGSYLNNAWSSYKGGF